MKKPCLLLYIFSLLFLQPILAQQPQKPTSSDIYNQIEKLNFLGSVLYVAAHPDDENTKLISYLSNETKARTGYLSLTRGDGGQNLIGTELRELLGVLRTQELLAARRIDGGEQFFTRANDFGYSKEPLETFEIWNKDAILNDVILTIRRFKPDVIINRFNHQTPGTTHGHHTASAILSFEAFDKANDPAIYPEHLKTVSIWQPKRLFFNTSWWFYGSEENFKKADKTNLVAINTGVYYPLKGKSNGEIAALSRSQHQCQGFGSTGTRGNETEYLEFLKGDFPKDKNNIFEGINTTWTRVKGGETIGKILTDIQKNFNFKNPEVHLTKLIEAYKLINQLEDEHWKKIKKQELENIIIATCGLYLESAASLQNTNPNGEISLKLEATNRCSEPIEIISVDFLNTVLTEDVKLENNVPFKIEKQIKIPENVPFSSPYWLNEKGTLGLFSVTDMNMIGKSETDPLKLHWKIRLCDVTLDIYKNLVYKFNDPVKGEMYKPFAVLPEVTTEILNKVELFPNNRKHIVTVKVRAGKDNCKGDVIFDLPADWKVWPKKIAFEIPQKGGEKTVTFEVTPPSYPTEAVAKSIAVIDGARFNKRLATIDYSHIPLQQVLMPSEAKFNKIEIETRGTNIGYIMGAGDEIPESLRQMDYNVTLLSPEKITSENIKDFDAILIGIRAYNTVEALKFKQNTLFDYVKNGGTMIVQYNTAGKLVTNDIAPFDLKLSQDRVTEETAKVTFLNPKHPVLNFPNKITEKDFECWIQEQGLYYPNKWAKEFTPILSSHDKNETPKDGGLLVAKYGNGHYIYTGLSFFRELPEGVPGAFRLMANLIAVGE
ncbi:putative LmbE-like protein [Flavobacterium enshiense DK69]|uniref:LmbE family protein n=1 Tax=Flavobacterium enshiense DK69 TaxID=1107311 RepID=V6S792_9FLAO|nr:PIG-L family deacetylase [Flavobacterium enshiense]ESU20245.1 putative LmbE-like protein [Flavobacterium enshiense DK69]KGO95940.1 LmbE family protein [Flavobacterium enshiense DK69]